MTDNKNIYKNHIITEDETDDTGSGSGSGGQGGDIEFKDFIGKGEPLREDLLPPEERRRLLSAHSQVSEANIKKQKARRDQYKQLKEGKGNLQEFRQAGLNSGYKPHTILADKRQFSGSDKQVNPLGNDHESETNKEQENELQYRYELQNRPTNAPRAAPKPSPFGKM
jgi:hypothetical protein